MVKKTKKVNKEIIKKEDPRLKWDLFGPDDKCTECGHIFYAHTDMDKFFNGKTYKGYDHCQHDWEVNIPKGIPYHPGDRGCTCQGFVGGEDKLIGNEDIDWKEWFRLIDEEIEAMQAKQ